MTMHNHDYELRISILFMQLALQEIFAFYVLIKRFFDVYNFIYFISMSKFDWLKKIVLTFSPSASQVS